MTANPSLQPLVRLYEKHGRALPPVVVLLLVVLIASQMARLIWALVPTPADGRWQPPAIPATPQKQQKADIQAIVGQNLFGAYQATLGEGGADAPETRLSLSLIGILSATDSGESRALIGSAGDDEKPYAIGDVVTSGVKLQAIFPDRVILSRSGALETLKLKKDAPTTAASPPRSPASSVPAGTTQMLSRIRDEVLTDPSKASQYIRVQPANVNGQLKGFRVYPGRERSAFNQLGLRPGDLITQVNGIQLDDSQKALQMLTELSKANSVSLTVERGGQPQNFNVTLN
ncbi:MAG TPA: type II secretion system protein GspC [Solimonas sp.]|nr:type II secretion system protein GspC [Solimonas sp.]